MPVIQFIPQTYCRTCHLSTRMDIPRCLHCNQLLEPAPVKAAKKRHRLKLTVKGKPQRGSHASRPKARTATR